MHLDKRRDQFAGFPNRCSKANSVVQVHRQQVIDDRETLFIGGVVDGRDVDQGRETATLVGFQPIGEFGNLLRRDRHVKFTEVGHVGVDHRIRLAFHNMGSQFPQGFSPGHDGYRTMVPVLRILR